MSSQLHIHGHFVLENDSALLLICSSPLVGNQALQDAAKYITISRLKHLTKGSCQSKPLTRLDNWCYLKFWQWTVSRELKDRRLTKLQFWSSMFWSSLNHGLNGFPCGWEIMRGSDPFNPIYITRQKLFLLQLKNTALYNN